MAHGPNAAHTVSVKVLFTAQSCLFIYILSMDTFALELNSCDMAFMACKAKLSTK